MIVLYLLECFQKKLKFRKKLVVYILWQFGSIGLCVFFLSYLHLPERFVIYIIAAITGSIYNLEGGIIYIILGVLFWIFKNQKKKLAVSFCIFDIVIFGLTTTSIISLSLGWIRFHYPLLTIPIEALGYFLDTVIGLPPVELGGSMWWNNYEWMMIGALPILLVYNKNRGRPLKWFFYIIYPVHIIVLWYIGMFFL